MIKPVNGFIKMTKIEIRTKIAGAVYTGLINNVPPRVMDNIIANKIFASFRLGASIYFSNLL